MKLEIVCDAVKKTCEDLPTLFCEYSMNNYVRCKKQGKKLAQMSSEGFFEIPLLHLILAAAVLALAAKCCCSARLLKKDKRDRCKDKKR